jgi:hypothetical protein
VTDHRVTIFDQLLRGLGDPNANVTKVETLGTHFDDAKALELGDVLHGNTDVTEMSLDIEDLTEAGNCGSLLSFIRDSQDLCGFYLHGSGISPGVLNRLRFSG